MKKVKNKKRIICRITAIFAIVIMILFSLPDNEVKADAVTDYLGIYVGYSGMELDEYVEVGDWHFSELEPYCYEENYSFMDYRGGSEYRAIVDSAYGIPIYDLLTDPFLGNINFADIMNIKFFVVAEGYGIRTAFDRDELFRNDRYYFNDLAGHREIIYANDDSYIIDHYDFDEAWTDCYEVEPMMALEDNWAQFNQEHENIGPDFSNLNPGTRFRLLFGQTEPTESQTGLSDKYVRYIYVTLYGSPSFGEMPEIDGSLGAHTAKATVSTQNGTLSDALDQFINLYSTDENILQITGVRVEHNDPYNADLADVYIDYEIVGEGQVAIYGTFGKQDYSTDINGMINQTIIDTNDFQNDFSDNNEGNGHENNIEEQPEDNPVNENQGQEENNPSDQKQAEPRGENPESNPGETTEKEKKEPETEKSATPNTGDDNNGGGRTDNSQNNNGNRRTDNSQNNNGNKITDSIQNNNSEVKPVDESAVTVDNIVSDAEAKVALADGEQLNIAAVEGKTMFYQITGDAAGKLDGLIDMTQIVQSERTSDKDITEVKVEDKTEEKEARRKRILFITGLCCVGLCIIGAFAEYFSFKFRLKKSMKDEMHKIRNILGRSAE